MEIVVFPKNERKGEETKEEIVISAKEIACTLTHLKFSSLEAAQELTMC